MNSYRSNLSIAKCDIFLITQPIPISLNSTGYSHSLDILIFVPYPNSIIKPDKGRLLYSDAHLATCRLPVGPRIQKLWSYRSVESGSNCVPSTWGSRRSNGVPSTGVLQTISGTVFIHALNSVTFDCHARGGEKFEMKWNKMDSDLGHDSALVRLYWAGDWEDWRGLLRMVTGENRIPELLISVSGYDACCFVNGL